jgi:hypothetical protein
MSGPLFVRVDPQVIVAYAIMVAVLVVFYRRANDVRVRLVIYFVSIILVFVFLLLFAPR